MKNPNKIKEYGSEFDWDSNLAFLLKAGQESYFHDAVLLRSGRDALRQITLHYRAQVDKVLLPALCCQSMVDPFIQSGIAVDFYRLQPNLTADENDLQMKMTPSSMVLIMRYFGIQALSDDFLFDMRKMNPRVVWVEDRTHDIFSAREKAAFVADETVVSIRKWVAIPEGGLLFTRRKVENLPVDESFSALRKAAMIKKSQYLACGDGGIKQEFRQTFQQANQILDQNGPPYGMGKISQEQLKQLDFVQMKKVRNSNATFLKTQLQTLQNCGKIRYIAENVEDSSLYMPIWVENQEEIQQKMAQASVYCPVIWPVPHEAQGTCTVAEDISAHMLALPCDHRYTTEDMKVIAYSLIQAMDVH